MSRIGTRTLAAFAALSPTAAADPAPAAFPACLVSTWFSNWPTLLPSRRNSCRARHRCSRRSRQPRRPHRSARLGRTGACEMTALRDAIEYQSREQQEAERVDRQFPESAPA